MTDFIETNSSRTVAVLLGMFPESNREVLIYELYNPVSTESFTDIDCITAIQPSEMNGNVIIYGTCRGSKKVHKVQINEDYCPLKLREAYYIQEKILDDCLYRTYAVGENAPKKYLI